MHSPDKRWYAQWQIFKDEEFFLFEDWIYPNILEDFQGKNILEAGCGGGQHTSFIAPYAKSVTAIDLNTISIARERNETHNNIIFLEKDIAEIDLGAQFDVVLSIGVIHHTDNPDKTVENLKRHVKRGGRLILWVYSKEGNAIVEHIVEPIRKIFFQRMHPRVLLKISRLITMFLYVPIYTIYLLPLPRLPYYYYFENFRKLSFQRNTLNIFDKLNAPQVQFITRQRITQWFQGEDFENVHITPYKNVSWRITAQRKPL